MNPAQVAQKLNELLQEVILANVRILAKEAIAGAIAGGVGSHAPITNDSEVDAASEQQLRTWAESWLPYLAA